MCFVARRQWDSPTAGLAGTIFVDERLSADAAFAEGALRTNDAGNAPRSSEALCSAQLGVSKMGSSSLEVHLMERGPLRILCEGERRTRRNDAQGHAHGSRCDLNHL